eukprot:CAMPEP_0113710970 /NCGR_PEP_ID=MMETSP0038_2-20120614/30475_1 /TAXON_ID=2898 /ORGANISM="Cryptomonas paramecium" /LENGTH=96 /DNA_ID=CAMNT_0000637131 /DNA_START=46 /DNA_END=336 /DNA_ORIENTATION=+ /assembly_acc=CAM_ASM_000170
MPLCPARSLNVEQLDVKLQRRVGRNAPCREPGGSVGVVGRADKIRFLAFAHLHTAFFPSLNNLQRNAFSRNKKHKHDYPRAKMHDSNSILDGEQPQ